MKENAFRTSKRTISPQKHFVVVGIFFTHENGFFITKFFYFFSSTYSEILNNHSEKEQNMNLVLAKNFVI